eukprot:360454-Chlamydomonas_euryale.AAC.7
MEALKEYTTRVEQAANKEGVDTVTGRAIVKLSFNLHTLPACHTGTQETQSTKYCVSLQPERVAANVIMIAHCLWRMRFKHSGLRTLPEFMKRESMNTCTVDTFALLDQSSGLVELVSNVNDSSISTP